MPIELDAIIFGGGAAGLWALDELTRNGRSALLLESRALGYGQTVASQGIIHGGLKYSLQGLLTRSTEQIREMPVLWRDCLEGKREPHLTETPLRSESCYLWRTDSVSSRLGMMGAKLGLRAAPEPLAVHQRPEVLQQCPGSVARLPEQVICPRGFLQNLADRHPAKILKIKPDEVTWERDGSGGVKSLQITDPHDEGARLRIKPNWVLFTAGAGNASLREAVGLDAPVMQRRPLHMVMLRGNLPILNGHCVDGAKTRITVTSTKNRSGQTVWQVGGQVAEMGVDWNPEKLIAHARKERLACIPGLDLSGVQWSRYLADRAEAKTDRGTRPESAQVLQDQNLLTAWPTKLALAPRLAEQLCEIVCQTPAVSASSPVWEQFDNWPQPEVADPPWETAAEWWQYDGEEPAGKIAA